MNNTHTSGFIKDTRKALGGVMNFRSGLSTPNGNILERSMRSHANSLEESKLSEQNLSYLNQSHLSYKLQNNLSSYK